MRVEKVPSLTFDLCIIGSGPAGIILALEYSRQNPHHHVLMIEYGTETITARNGLDDTVHISNARNHHPPYECTNKVFGGTTASWGGRCVMFDEVDFTDRAILNGGCTWNLDLYQEITDFLPRTAAYFECGAPVFNLDEYPHYRHTRIAEGFQSDFVSDAAIERWSMPTRFGQRYAKEIDACANLTVMLAQEAKDFAAPNSNGEISSLLIRQTHNGQLQQVNARAFVLAAGAQESTRILLRNKQLFELLGSVPAALGKYYQGHVSGKIASIRFTGDPKKTDYGFMQDADGTYLRRRFQFSKEFLVAQNLLNIALWLDNPLYYKPSHRSGAMSFMYLAMITPVLGKKLAPPAIAQAVTHGKTTAVGKHVYNIMKDLPGSLLTPATIFYRRYCKKRKLPGVFLYSPNNCYALHFHAEQTPDIQNSMTLGANGQTLVIDYSLTDADVDSVIRAHEKLDEALRQCNCGSLEYWFDKKALPEAIRNMSRDGIHQCGTTRIAGSPASGVVDQNLLLWGTTNVFVCSSSVFPTSGQANPTFMLGAFAVRLSQHLSKKAKQKNISPVVVQF